MEFVRACASRLDAGECAEAVLSDMRVHYTTAQCMNTKVCLVRKLCRPTEAYERAVQANVTPLPPKHPPNVRALRISPAERAECKRLAAHSAIAKNRTRVRVDGRSLLRTAREAVAAPAAQSFTDLVFALMLLTGRRTCEVLNGTSVFSESAPYTLRFTGAAKRHVGDVQVPTLERASTVLAAFAELRARQGHAELTNRATSTRYQGTLSRALAVHPVWRQCKRVHALRAVYACMTLRLFTWEGDASDAYVAMTVLGHTGITDSLVYTPYSLGEFDEPVLATQFLDISTVSSGGAGP
jgi:integrase